MIVVEAITKQSELRRLVDEINSAFWDGANEIAEDMLLTHSYRCSKEKPAEAGSQSKRLQQVIIRE